MDMLLIWEASVPSEKDMLLPIPLTVMNVHTSWKNNLGY